MKRIEQIKEALINCAEWQVAHLENVNAAELGELIDMIKDMEEYCYYHTVTEAMKKEHPANEMLKSHDLLDTHHFKGVDMKELEEYVKKVMKEATPQEKESLKKLIESHI